MRASGIVPRSKSALLSKAFCGLGLLENRRLMKVVQLSAQNDLAAAGVGKSTIINVLSNDVALAARAAIISPLSRRAAWGRWLLSIRRYTMARRF